LHHAVEPESVAEVWTLDRQCPALREIGGTTRVVKMPVCQQDFF
jgi:hypothetical protein